MALLWYMYVSHKFEFSANPSISLTSLGLLGDSFNILTSLFAGLAFAAVLITIRVQKKELEETREEFKKQREIMDLQQFDNKFFQLLNVFNEVIKNIKTFQDGYKNGGSMVFQELGSKILFRFSAVEAKNFIEAYERANSTYNLSLKYYFLNLYQVLNYIDTDYPLNNQEEKKRYTNIVRAQLSKDELVLLLYNCIGIERISGNRYKMLVEKYAFFEHINYKDLLTKEGCAIYDLHSNLVDEKTKEDIKKYLNQLIQSYSFNGIEQKDEFNCKDIKKCNIEITNSLLLQYEKAAFGKNSNLLNVIDNLPK